MSEIIDNQGITNRRLDMNAGDAPDPDKSNSSHRDDPLLHGFVAGT